MTGEELENRRNETIVESSSEDRKFSMAEFVECNKYLMIFSWVFLRSRMINGTPWTEDEEIILELWMIKKIYLDPKCLLAWLEALMNFCSDDRWLTWNHRWSTAYLEPRMINGLPGTMDDQWLTWNHGWSMAYLEPWMINCLPGTMDDSMAYLEPWMINGFFQCDSFHRINAE